jgi:hypothetical protein
MMACFGEEILRQWIEVGEEVVLNHIRDERVDGRGSVDEIWFTKAF